MNLGELIDDLYAKRAIRLELARQVDDAKGLEDAAKLALIEKLHELGLGKATGSMATASIKTIQIPRVTDWDLMYQWIRDTGRFDMLHKRISEVAWRDTVSAEGLVPGTESVDDVKLSLVKSSR